MQNETGPPPLEAHRLNNAAAPMSSSALTNMPRSFAYGVAPEQPDTPCTPCGAQKGRVLVKGPGGAETKQGAKIACLECRSAKIKCSAPTDGHVPCKRCVKHGKECLFEKHKRGRKPNKRFSVPGSGMSIDAGGSQDGDAMDGGDEALRPVRARSSEGPRETAMMTTNTGPSASGRPKSSGQPHQLHSTNTESYFGPGPGPGHSADVEQRFRSWSNAEAPSRVLEHPTLPWQCPQHAHPSGGHHVTSQQQQQQQHHQHVHQHQYPQQHHSQQHPLASAARTGEDATPSHNTLHGADRAPPYVANGPTRHAYTPVSGSSIAASASAPSGMHQLSTGSVSSLEGAATNRQPDQYHHNTSSTALQPYQQQKQGERHASDYGSSAATAGGGVGGGRWKEQAGSHHASSPRSAAGNGLVSTAGLTGGDAESSATAAYGHNHNRSYGQGGPAPSHNYLHWDSQLGLERGSRSWADHPRSPTGGGVGSNHTKDGKGGEGGPPYRNGQMDEANGNGGRKLANAAAAGSSASSPHGHPPVPSPDPRPGSSSPAAAARRRPVFGGDDQHHRHRQQDVNGSVFARTGADCGAKRSHNDSRDRCSGPGGSGGTNAAHGSAAAAAPSSSQAGDADVEFEDEQDELEDDADATREEHDNVLSNPLKLLAQASDAAAARIEGGRLGSGGRNSLAAAETMGLLTGGTSASRMAMSAAVNLTGLGRPMPMHSRYPADEMMPPQGWSSSRILPPLVHHQPHQNHGHHYQDRSGRHRDAYAVDRGSRLPAFLNGASRSKSFPSAEAVPAPETLALTSLSAGPPDDIGGAPLSSDVRVATRELLLSGRDADPLRGHNGTPSTLDHDAWEYREGKAQTRRGYANSSGPGASPGTLSHGSQTTSSATSVNFTAPSSASARQRLGDSPHSGIVGGGGGDPPSDEMRFVLSGKRKRSHSRLARGLHRNKRRLNERDTDAEVDMNASNDERPPVPSEARGGREKQVSISADVVRKDGVGSGSGGEGEAGASRKGYFNLSMFHSKNDDDDEGLDPVELGLVELKEVERLFDLFFARINPILDLFDPFLHSVSFVRMRSAFLTTVISCMAARLSDTVHDAKIATVLDRHWQKELLPMILLDGYKSVEISQAFLILTTYSRPTSRLVDDRSWQYLGFAIRTATEVGVNRKVTPSESLLGNEQVSRRLRNRERLWFNLFLYDRTLSAQTGRPWTISEDRMIVQSSMWHKQDFALPEDVSLVSLIKLRRIAAQHSEAFDNYLNNQDQLDAAQTAVALNAGEQSHFERRLAGLEFFRKHANADLEKWKQSWCINTGEKIRAVDTSTAAGKYLVRWAPTAKLFYYHSRLIINSLVLGTTEQHEDLLSGSSASVECWTSAISLIDTVLNDFDDESLVAWSNDRVVMAVYAAVSALRLTNLESKYPFADKETAIALVRRLSTAFTKAGKTPRHRNGSANPYGRYLKSVLAIFEPGAPGSQAQAQAQTPDKNSENAMSIAASSLTPGDSGSQTFSPAEQQHQQPAKSSVLSSAAATKSSDGIQEGSPSSMRNGAKPGMSNAKADNVVASVPPASSIATAGPPSADKPSAETADVWMGASDLASATSYARSVSTPNVEMALFGSGGAVIVVDTIKAEAESGASSAAAPSPAKVVVPDLPDLDDELAILDTSRLTDGLPIDAWASPPGRFAAANAVGGPGSQHQHQQSNAARLDAEAAAAATAAALSSVLDPNTDPNDPVVMTIASTAAASAGGDGSGSANPFASSGGGAVASDDPESIDRLWDCLTAFEPQGFSGAFWQPPSTWNMSSGANGASGGTSGNGA